MELLGTRWNFMSANDAPFARCPSCWRSRDRDRHIDEDFVALRLRLGLVLFVQILDRAARQIGHRQDHDTNETRRRIGRLREYRIGSPFKPGAARSIRRRSALGVDADAAVEEATDAGPLMAVHIGAAAGG